MVGCKVDSLRGTGIIVIGLVVGLVVRAGGRNLCVVGIWCCVFKFQSFQLRTCRSVSSSILGDGPWRTPSPESLLFVLPL